MIKELAPAVSAVLEHVKAEIGTFRKIELFRKELFDIATANEIVTRIGKANHNAVTFAENSAPGKFIRTYCNFIEYRTDFGEVIVPDTQFAELVTTAATEALFRFDLKIAAANSPVNTAFYNVVYKGSFVHKYSDLEYAVRSIKAMSYTSEFDEAWIFVCNRDGAELSTLWRMGESAYKAGDLAVEKDDINIVIDFGKKWHEVYPILDYLEHRKEVSVK